MSKKVIGILIFLILLGVYIKMTNPHRYQKTEKLPSSATGALCASEGKRLSDKVGVGPMDCCEGLQAEFTTFEAPRCLRK